MASAVITVWKKNGEKNEEEEEISHALARGIKERWERAIRACYASFESWSCF